MKLLNDLFRLGAAPSAEQSGEITLNADHPIYRAHFPGQPITPGVITVQIITEVLEQELGRRLTLREVKNVKFLIPIIPTETPRIFIQKTLTKMQKSPISSGKIGSFETESVQAKGAVLSSDTQAVLCRFSLIYDFC